MKKGGVYSPTRDKLNHYSRRVASTFIDASPFAPPLSLASPFRTSSSPSKTCPKAVLSLNYPRTRSPSAPRPAATKPASRKPPLQPALAPSKLAHPRTPPFSPIQVPLMDGRRSRSASPDTQTASGPEEAIPSTLFPSQGGPSSSSPTATLAGPPWPRWRTQPAPHTIIHLDHEYGCHLKDPGLHPGRIPPSGTSFGGPPGSDHQARSEPAPHPSRQPSTGQGSSLMSPLRSSHLRALGHLQAMGHRLGALGHAQPYLRGLGPCAAII